MKITMKWIEIACAFALCASLCFGSQAAAAGNTNTDVINRWISMTPWEMMAANEMVAAGFSMEQAVSTYKQGDQGKDVLELKNKLKDLGYYSPTATFDDEYNSTMVQRVKDFQKNNNLDTHGRIDIPTHAAILLASSTTVKGQWYVEKAVANLDDIYSALNAERKHITGNGHKINLRNSEYYFSKKMPAEAMINNSVTTFIWDRTNLQFSAQGIKRMILQSLPELETAAMAAYNQYQCAPLNVELYSKLVDSPQGLYLEMLDSLYVYGKRKNGTEWDACPFVVTQTKGSRNAADNTLYVFVRFADANRSDSDQYTEMYISDKETVKKIVELFLESIDGVSEQDRSDMMKYLK